MAHWYEHLPIIGPIIQGAGAEGQPLDTQDIDDARRRAADFYNQTLAERGNVTTAVPQVNGRTVNAPTIDDAQAQEIRRRQALSLDQLQGAAAGTAPSAAAAQLRLGQRDIAQQQLGLAGQAHGNAGVFARREAARNIATGQQVNNLQAAQVRAQEMAQARGQLGGALSDVRGADTALAFERARQKLAADTTTAGLGQRAEESNQGAVLRGQQITNDMKIGLGQQALTGNQQTILSATDIARLKEARRRQALERADNSWQSLANFVPFAPGSHPAGGGAAPDQMEPTMF